MLFAHTLPTQHVNDAIWMITQQDLAFLLLN